MHRAVCTCMHASVHMHVSECWHFNAVCKFRRRKIKKRRYSSMISQGSLKFYLCSVRSHLQTSFLPDTSHSVSLEVTATSNVKLNETHHYLEQKNRYAQCTTQQNVSQTSRCILDILMQEMFYKLNIQYKGPNVFLECSVHSAF